MDYYFKTEKMTVGYEGKPLIEDIELRLKKGEILTLIGPNGAGKSTVLKSISRQLSLISGVVWLGNDRLLQLSGNQLAKRMAVVLTERLRGERMTCADVAATGRYPYTGRFGILSAEDRRIVEEAMNLVHVAELADREFTRISDGQRQRVMLARAICQEPEILILDEPTSYLDVKYKLEFLSILQKMRQKKKWTIIMSLHELELAARVSDRILCLNGKYADRFGSPEEIFQKDYISGLFGVSAGSFDEENITLELAAPRGEPEVFVLAGGGTGRAAYRSLQRRGVPFATGILFENDLDYPAARALAAVCVAGEAFEPLPEDLLAWAKAEMDRCGEIICCRERFGSMEEVNRALFEHAMRLRDEGKRVELWGQGGA